MAKTFSSIKENPKILESTPKNGLIHLYLEYYLGREQTPILDENGKQRLYIGGKMAGKPMFAIKHQRKKESLHLYLIAKPKTFEERQRNTEIRQKATCIRFEREQAMLQESRGYRLKFNKQSNFIEFYQHYIKTYKKKDLRNIELSFRRFTDFLHEQYPVLEKKLRPELISPTMVQQFVEYLQGRSTGTGANSIYGRFKKVVFAAMKEGIIIGNPCFKISCTTDEETLKKDILSTDEIQQLLSCHYINENPEIQRAFTFCLYTGIRFCDVKELQYKNVDYSNHLLQFKQGKTGKAVAIPLNNWLLSLIGPPPADRNGNNLIFHLPSHTMCLKALRHWTKKAGIEKHITWHCGRHSFAVNILNNGANIKTVASLLGHSGLKHTEKYTRAVDGLKEAAINSLPTPTEATI